MSASLHELNLINYGCNYHFNIKDISLLFSTSVFVHMTLDNRRLFLATLQRYRPKKTIQLPYVNNLSPVCQPYKHTLWCMMCIINLTPRPMNQSCGYILNIADKPRTVPLFTCNHIQIRVWKIRTSHIWRTKGWLCYSRIILKVSVYINQRIRELILYMLAVIHKFH